MSDTTSSIFSILKELNIYPECFYGPFARLSMEITVDQSLRIGIAPIHDHAKGKRPEKGVESYNNKEAVFFTLNSNDLCHIFYNINSIVAGKYINNHAKEEKDKNIFSLTHFNSNKKPSFFSLKAQQGNKVVVSIKDADGKTGSFMLMDEIEQDPSGKPIYTGRNYSLTQFRNVVKSLVENGVFDKLNFQAIIKRFKMALFNVSNESNSGESSSGNSNYKNNYKNNQNSNYNKKETKKPEPQIQTPTASSEDEMGDVAFSSFGYGDDSESDGFNQQSDDGWGIPS